MAASKQNPPHLKWKGKFGGAHEIARWANVEPPFVNELAKKEWFPEPADYLHMGRVWDFAEVKAILSERGYPKELSYKERYPKNDRAPVEDEEGTE